jgi:opacity protein-like surface antigen
MRRLLPLVCVATLHAASAHAQGFYVGGGAGAAFLESALNTNGPAFLIDSDYGTGWLLRGEAGYAFANGLRVEGEIGYRQNDVTKLRIDQDGGLGRSLGLPPLNGAVLTTTGDESSLAFMANAWYDIRTGTPFTPYVGGGVGFSRAAFNSLAAGGLTLVDDSDIVFAYQFGAGLAYAITPQLSATVDYRFFATSDPTFTDFEGVSFSSEYQSHSITGGFRFTF